MLPAADDGSAGSQRCWRWSRRSRQIWSAAADGGGAAVIEVTRLGGAFGSTAAARPRRRRRRPAATARAAALSGFLKTLAMSGRRYASRPSISTAPPTAELAAAALAAELFAADGLVEVGYRDGERTQLAVSRGAAGRRQPARAATATASSSITGGARGITAAAAAQAGSPGHRSTLVLVGRTPPRDEPAETAGISDPPSSVGP